MTSNSIPILLANKETSDNDGGGLSGGVIAVIVIACIIFAAALVVAGFFVLRKLRDRNKNHGEYRPQYEETVQAKDLPYLPPPNIEGLI
uniref:4.1m domain-containing protein n=1 Tax=Syphacia muris TaxID=451379 RepID=A0A0N5AWZ6_9BILA